MSKELAEILQRLKTCLRKIHGDRLVKMVLFGSQARGEASTDPDIDVLVILKGNVNPGEEIKKTSDVVAELSLEYDQVISRLFIDESRFNSYNRPLLQNIRREGIAF